MVIRSYSAHVGADVRRLTCWPEEEVGASSRRLLQQGERAALTTELLVAMAILVIALFPLAYSFGHEQKFLRACYNRSVAMEIVDGEMEVLLAGEWRMFKQGTQEYTPHSSAIANLPKRTLQLNIASKHLKLEWLPPGRDQGGHIVREADLP